MNKVHRFFKTSAMWTSYSRTNIILKKFCFSKIKVLVLVLTLNFCILEFLKRRVKQYQEKKLDEALSKIQFHTDMEKKLKNTIDCGTDLKLDEIQKELSFHREMILVWTKNVEKIKKELQKIGSWKYVVSKIILLILYCSCFFVCVFVFLNF